MNFKRLETFVWVATLGSFRKAAERQHTTQPAISSRISTLEEELGVKLFEREMGPGPVSLTAKGKELLPYAEKIIYMQEQLRKRANNVQGVSGLLRLGVSETIVHTWLPEFLRRLNNEMPHLEVEMTVDVTSNLRAGLLDRSVDLAFLMGPISDPSIANLSLCSFPLAWIASPSLGLPDRLLNIEELAQWPIITYARNTKPFAEISQRFRAIEGSSVRFMSSSSLSACYRLTVDGVGISTLPYRMIKEELEKGIITQLNASWTPSELQFTASYSAVPYNSIAEQASELAVIVSETYANEGI
ncbi:LysR family transcriptional regulator [Marinobacterium marinum]|uniref:LysR family transcriptional regulator n=1 Tax=Marinobacterium marinum TaxID=2756129 RepID=A0A7W1WZC4_9GAMM|nr:LysR family transcriptional regulator [Marinobacterium marinum]MBA4503019.1 LysR family transcriptional regulator [Marinobacterium marinum]